MRECFLCHGVHRQTNISLGHPWAAVWRVWRWFALAPQTIIHANMHTCVYVYRIYLLFVCLLVWVYLTAGCPTLFSPRYRQLNLNNNQFSALPPDLFPGLSSLQWVCVFHVHARMLAYLFPFLSVKTQSYLCFTNVYELFRQSSTQTCILLCLCMYIFFLFVSERFVPKEIGTNLESWYYFADLYCVCLSDF